VNAAAMPSAQPVPVPVLVPVLVNASRFRAAHQGDWERLDHLVARIEKRGVTALGDEDLLILPLLYRATLSSLAVARETSLDRALVQYLEQLCTRAYFQIYGVQTSAWRQFGQFLVYGWPTAVQALWKETLAALLVTIVAAVAGYLMVRNDPSSFYLFVGKGMAEGRDPTASYQTLWETIHATKASATTATSGTLSTFASFLFSHNAQISIFCFALGFAFGVPTMLLLAQNGVMLGAMIAVFASKGLGPEFVAWLSIHGTTEFFAIFLAGAGGFRIGLATAFPGRERRLDAAVKAGRTAALVLGGAVIMLMVAALLEGIGRQLIDNSVARVTIGVAMLTGWLVYFYLPRGRRGEENV
jgi:uncharacterized membrane protein SpoIIM required for sporulation